MAKVVRDIEEIREDWQGCVVDARYNGRCLLLGDFDAEERRFERQWAKFNQARSAARAEVLAWVIGQTPISPVTQVPTDRPGLARIAAEQAEADKLPRPRDMDPDWYDYWSDEEIRAFGAYDGTVSGLSWVLVEERAPVVPEWDENDTSWMDLL